MNPPSITHQTRIPSRGIKDLETNIYNIAAARGKTDTAKGPLALDLLNSDRITAQGLSPLYNKIPAEVRELIWQFACIQYEDFRFPYEQSKRYCRPGQAARQSVAVEVFLTCRAIYVETFYLPFIMNPIVVFDGDSLDKPPGTVLKGTPLQLRDTLKLLPWQFAAINKVEIVAQQINLEGGTLERVARLIGSVPRHRGCIFQGHALTGYPSMVELVNVDDEDLQKVKSGNSLPRQPRSLIDLCICKRITRLTIRMNRTDWWSWSNEPSQSDADSPDRTLRLEPFINHTKSDRNSRAMLEGWTKRATGIKYPDFDLDDFEKQGRWGAQIQEFWPDLQILELVLETFAAKTKQLARVVECAKLWTFPVSERYELRWNSEEHTTEWQGAALYSYEPMALWAIKHPVETGASRKRYVPSLIQRVKGSKSKPLNGQRFVVKTVTYERKKAAA